MFRKAHLQQVYAHVGVMLVQRPNVSGGQLVLQQHCPLVSQFGSGGGRERNWVGRGGASCDGMGPIPLLDLIPGGDSDSLTQDCFIYRQQNGQR